MKCAECGAFESAFKAAGVRFAAATYKLEERASLLRDATALRLQREVKASRLDYKMAKEALRVHREGHKKS